MMTERPNVILLTIDALRADHVGYHGYERNTTTFLDSLANRVARFDTCISASSHTREAVPALLSGEYPDVFAANGYRHTTETVADRLSTAGYATAGFHSNPYVSRAYGFDSGFDTFDDDVRLGRNRFAALLQRALDKFLLNKGEYHKRAEAINKDALDWLDAQAGPAFLWNHYMDVHGPYNPPEAYTYADREITNGEAHDLYQKIIKRPHEVTKSERQLLIDCYDGEIRYLDAQLKRFFDAIAARGLLDESLVILTADHGDAFGEHGYFTHPRHLHESLLHVPLLVSVPGDSPRGIGLPVSTLDLVPTILEWTGIEYDLPGEPLLCDGTVSIDGHSGVAFASAQGENEYSDVRRFSVRDDRRKVIIERDLPSNTVRDCEAFDLDSDPTEQNPLDCDEAQDGELLRRLNELSRDRVRVQNTQGEAQNTADPSPEIEDRLEALGYK
jgi:arylsulfatase